MSDMVRLILTRLLLIGLLSGVLSVLAQEKAQQTAVQFSCGLLALLAILQPVQQLPVWETLHRVLTPQQTFFGSTAQNRDTLERALSEALSTAIENAAAAQDVCCKVEYVLQYGEDNVMKTDHVHISFSGTEEDRVRLRGILEAYGIPEERQEWSDT